MPVGQPTEEGKTDAQPRDERTRFATKLNDDVHARVVSTLAAGMPIEMAAVEAGIVRQTFYNWMREGREAIAQANGDLEDVLETNPYARFAYDVEQAQARFVLGNLTSITAIGRGRAEGTWQALAWQLERRFPSQFGRRTRHEITGADGGPVRYQHAIALDPEALERLSAEQLRQLREIVAVMEGEVVDGEEPLLLNP